MRIGVLGAGDVGKSVIELANEYGHTVTAFADSQSAVVDANGIDVQSALSKKRSDDVVGDGTPEDALKGPYDVLVEATPTTLGDAEPGFSHIRTALQRDRHVVLANKGPIGERYTEVRELEAESAGSVRFGATVGGSLPVLSTIDDFGASRVTAVYGVLNGTANFILSRMATEGLDYEHVLAEAQDLGVAEADPSFDVDGTDTALKAVIIANILSQDTDYSLKNVSVEGIQDISGGMLDLAQEGGMTIRLIAEVSNGTVRVGPRLVSNNSSLAPGGTRNSVQLETKHAGYLNVSGRGAGGPETASSVLTDIKRLPKSYSLP